MRSYTRIHLSSSSCAWIMEIRLWLGFKRCNLALRPVIGLDLGVRIWLGMEFGKCCGWSCAPAGHACLWLCFSNTGLSRKLTDASSFVLKQNKTDLGLSDPSNYHPVISMFSIVSEARSSSSVLFVDKSQTMSSHSPYFRLRDLHGFHNHHSSETFQLTLYWLLMLVSSLSYILLISVELLMRLHTIMLQILQHQFGITTTP